VARLAKAGRQEPVIGLLHCGVLVAARQGLTAKRAHPELPTPPQALGVWGARHPTDLVLRRREAPLGAKRPRRTIPEAPYRTVSNWRRAPGIIGFNDGSDQLGGASIYILLCSDGSYYTGITRRSVEERVSEHAQGLMPGYTFTRRPVKLVFSEHYERIVDAIAAERRIKGWSRAKKEAYMRGDFSALVALATRGPKDGV
jgi:putative endonuclease